MFNGESKKRQTVSLGGKRKEEDRTEFIRRARAQRERRARERLHVSSATTIQRVWRGRSCVGKWREREREAWDKKMHDVGRVQAMLAKTGKVFQVPSGVLQTLLSHLVNFHTFPRDANRFRTALGLVLAAAGDAAADPQGTGLFAPLAAAVSAHRGNVSNTWTLLVARIGVLCLHYMAQMAEAAEATTGAGKASSGADAMDDDTGGGTAGVEAKVRAAAESAVQGFVLLSSPEEWRRRGLLEGRGAEAESICQKFLISLALGRVELGWKDAATGRYLGKGVRLAVRTDVGAVSVERTRAPRLFGVLRILWDDAGAGKAAGLGLDNAVRLMCASSLRALGVESISTRVEPSAGDASTTQSVVGQPCGDRVSLLERKALLEAFSSAVLPAPRLLDHPLKALLVDPMLAGDARVWWELVSVAGVAVGEGEGEGAAARRRDVAWAVANVLRVDTGAGASTPAVGAEHARCLVRALCRLLRKVSLHALLQGAGQMASATAGGSAGSAGVRVTEMDDDDDDGMEMDGVFSDVAGRGGAGSGGNGSSDDFAGGGIRLEAIVRHHRRRCALRTEALPAEPQPAVSSGFKRRGVLGVPGDSTVSMEVRAGEAEAMATAAETLADPGVVGKLFDSILPSVARFSSDDPQVEDAASTMPGSTGGSGASSNLGESTPTPARTDSTDDVGGDGDDDDDPVLALCSLYADLVMDGVRAGPAGAGSAANSASGGIGAAAGSPASTPGKSVLNALAFGRPREPIAARLWAYLRQRHDLVSFAKGGNNVAERRVGARAGGGVQSALFLFCSACSHQLLALDDEEFYEKQRPLTLEEVRQLADFLKKWLCRLYWLDPAIPRLLEENLPFEPSAALRQCEDRLREALLLLSATRLFNQLYERNTRRSFLEAKAWYWKAISAKELSPPDRGDSRLDFFSTGNLGMVLTNIPQVIPFFQRVGIFRAMIESERGEHQSTSSFSQSSARIRVSRETLYEDSAEQLTKLGSALKGRVQVTFMNQHGVEEAGIDGGGVFKEYMDLLTKRAFDPQYALFLATEDQYLFPNPAASMVAEDYLFHFEFLGRVLAKAVFEDILVEPQFSPVFLNKLLGRHNYIDDLYSLDPELYRNLMQLKAIVQKGGDVADLCLTFSATTAAFGETKVWDLIPGGRDVAVTNSSVINYIHLMAHFKLNVQTARPCKAFLQGFRDLIPVEWIRLFNPQELQRLIGGEGGRAIDVEDLRRNTRYAGGYHESQPVMQWFWEAIESFNPEEQGQFLKFVTSCSRPPLLGFERLNPPICLQRVPDGEDGRLPSSATCMNLLKLPQYPDRQTLREKLLYSISANAGFELT